ncbi:Uncharacterized protein TCM_005916 [Theobroma cacao]|uniref:Disease resistance N-terminal domain-containing protein n=1 Tax=Theobroma cacao TaxID=3641 RepID=A0A061DXE5_THECC|nr:Uncharacterized protein TCM_005916 [Theobroma cacao]
MGGEFLLKIWVNALKDFHYDMEDLLDEYSIETRQCRWSTECQESTAEQGLSSPLLPYYLDIVGYLMMTRGLLASSLNFWLSIQGLFAPDMYL